MSLAAHVCMCACVNSRIKGIRHVGIKVEIICIYFAFNQCYVNQAPLNIILCMFRNVLGLFANVVVLGLAKGKENSNRGCICPCKGVNVILT